MDDIYPICHVMSNRMFRLKQRKSRRRIDLTRRIHGRSNTDFTGTTESHGKSRFQRKKINTRWTGKM